MIPRGFDDNTLYKFTFDICTPVKNTTNITLITMPWHYITPLSSIHSTRELTAPNVQALGSKLNDNSAWTILNYYIWGAGKKFWARTY